jgi:cytoskeletal protein RodZ
MHSFDHDKELDLLTKAAAEAIDAPSSANWEKMQRTLDKELPQQKKRRGGIVWWILPALLVAGLGIYWLNFNTTQNIQENNNTQIKHQEPITKTIVPEIVKPIELKVNELNQTKNNNNSKQAKRNTNNHTTKDADLSEVKNSKNAKEGSAILPDVNSIANASNINCCKEIQEKKTTPSFTSNDTVNLKQSVKIDEPINNTQTNPIATNLISLKPATKKGFFIGLIGGFDASTVKYNYASNVGYNIGGTLGYRFNNHLSVQTGAIYTQKNYKLKGQDFHAPKGSWISYYEIETVDGYCKMWDVPMIATYHFTGNENGNTFISVGASSYFMKHENYNYLYFYNNQYYNRTSNYNSTDQHLFALLHISAGIERPIGKNITGIIEPYAKIPLAGVGLGSIQLSSFGLNFSVQYRQPKK